MDDIKTLSDRLQVLLKEMGISRNAFAKSIGVSLSTFLGYLNENREPGYSFISKLMVKYPRVNPDWLLNGRGEIWRASAEEKERETNYQIELLQVKVQMLEENNSLYKRLLDSNDPETGHKPKKNHSGPG